MMPVVFDLDGTLVDSLPDIAAAANRLLEAEGIVPLPLGTVAGFVGLGERVFIERLIAACDLDPARFDELLGAFLPIYEACSDTVLFDGVAELLQALSTRGVPLGICTNKPSGPLQHVLAGLPQRDLIGTVIAGDTLPVRKPHPEPLLLAFERLGADRGLYVGDSETDAETARRAGVPFALYKHGIRTTPLDQIPHDLAFDRFDEVLRFYNTLV